MSRIATVRPVGHIGQRNVRRCVGPEQVAHHLVRSGQRLPVPSKELGLGAERGRGLPSEGTCRTQYSSAINGTDSSAMLPKSGTAAKYFWSV